FASVAALTKGIVMTGTMTRITLLMLATAALLGFGIAAVPTNSTQTPKGDSNPSTASATKPAVRPTEADPKPTDSPAEKAEEFRYAGTVLDPSGKPLSGATIWISGFQAGVVQFLPRVQTGPDGRFDFAVRRDEFKTRRPTDKPGTSVMIGVTA